MEAGAAAPKQARFAASRGAMADVPGRRSGQFDGKVNANPFNRPVGVPNFFSTLK